MNICPSSVPRASSSSPFAGSGVVGDVVEVMGDVRESSIIMLAGATEDGTIPMPSSFRNACDLGRVPTCAALEVGDTSATDLGGLPAPTCTDLTQAHASSGDVGRHSHIARLPAPVSPHRAPRVSALVDDTARRRALPIADGHAVVQAHHRSDQRARLHRRRCRHVCPMGRSRSCWR